MSGNSVSASRARFHAAMAGWLPYAYRPPWSIELNTVAGW
jgi:hypothetical protein